MPAVLRLFIIDAYNKLLICKKLNVLRRHNLNIQKVLLKKIYIWILVTPMLSFRIFYHAEWLATVGSRAPALDFEMLWAFTASLVPATELRNTQLEL